MATMRAGIEIPGYIRWTALVVGIVGLLGLAVLSSGDTRAENHPAANHPAVQAPQNHADQAHSG